MLCAAARTEKGVHALETLFALNAKPVFGPLDLAALEARLAALAPAVVLLAPPVVVPKPYDDLGRAARRCEPTARTAW